MSPYVVAYYVPSPPKRFNATSCVIFARQYTDLDLHGVAGNIKPTVSRPYAGGVVLLNEGTFGHVAVIVDVASKSLSLIEANYQPGKISSRSISIDYPRIRGYK